MLQMREIAPGRAMLRIIGGHGKEDLWWKSGGDRQHRVRRVELHLLPFIELNKLKGHQVNPIQWVLAHVDGQPFGNSMHHICGWCVV